MGHSLSAQLADLILLYRHYHQTKKSPTLNHPWLRFRDNILTQIKAPPYNKEETIIRALKAMETYCAISLKVETEGPMIESLGYRLLTTKSEDSVTLACGELNENPSTKRRFTTPMEGCKQKQVSQIINSIILWSYKCIETPMGLAKSILRLALQTSLRKHNTIILHKPSYIH